MTSLGISWARGWTPSASQPRPRPRGSSHAAQRTDWHGVWQGGSRLALAPATSRSTGRRPGGDSAVGRGPHDAAFRVYSPGFRYPAHGGVRVRGGTMSASNPVAQGQNWQRTRCAGAGAGPERVVARAARGRSRRRQASRRRGSKSIRCGPSRCPTTGCSARPSASTVDDRDHIWIIHRGNDPGTLASTAPSWRSSRRASPRVGECCDAAPPVLEFDAGRQPRRSAGAARWRARLRVARVEPRHRRRPQGLRVDRRQRRQRRPHPEVHARRQVRGPVRQVGRAPRSEVAGRASRPTSPTAWTWTTSAASRRSSSTPRPTRATSPTATSTTASR